MSRVAVFFLVMVAGCGRPDMPRGNKEQRLPDDGRLQDVENPIFGKWEVVSGETQGKEIKGRQAWGMAITFAADRAVWHFNRPEGKKSYDGYCRIDLTKQPNEIDLRQPASEDVSKTALGIYKIDGDRLWISMGNVRPKDFDENTMIKLVFERVKS